MSYPYRIGGEHDPAGTFGRSLRHVWDEIRQLDQDYMTGQIKKKKYVEERKRLKEEEERMREIEEALP